MKKIDELFNLDESILKKYFSNYEYPFEVLPNIGKIIIELGSSLGDDYIKRNGNIWIHQTAKIGMGVEIYGPCIIMENTEIRHNAFLRENVIIGPNSVVGNSCEIKNSILLNKCEVPHFNYVGDSILGNCVHLGAGVVISNLRLDKENIVIDGMNTNLRKIGAFIGDNVQIGCNSVINPGTIISSNAFIYPLMSVKGIVDEGKIVKHNNIKIERL